MTGPSTMPAQNHATSEKTNSASVSGNSTAAQPPTDRKPAPGSHSPMPAACKLAEAPSNVGSRPATHSAA
jgi:hypothetical protein